ncbi:hypothetical protein [Myxococcus phage Mx1]|nr:hypothetical protein [Myxococcus phage Mx1]
MYRITFSRSLAEYMIQKLEPGYELARLTFTTGRRLEPGEESQTGLYALVSVQKDWPLRITHFRDWAAEMVDPDWRYIAECHVLKAEMIK